jgi:hypothetical protein
MDLSNVYLLSPFALCAATTQHRMIPIPSVPQQQKLPGHDLPQFQDWHTWLAQLGAIPLTQ